MSIFHYHWPAIVGQMASKLVASQPFKVKPLTIEITADDINLLTKVFLSSSLFSAICCFRQSKIKSVLAQYTALIFLSLILLLSMLTSYNGRLSRKDWAVTGNDSATSHFWGNHVNRLTSIKYETVWFSEKVLLEQKSVAALAFVTTKHLLRT